ncbi:MAG: hypothetical protein Q8P81_01950 [Nanoarchaeota archaeon]|nr:hypothetical protein [Nanoarchaeota archaeon]
MSGGELLTDFILAVKEFYATLPSFAQTFVTLFSLVVLVVIYSVFVWRLHISIGTKNIFTFNLDKHNNSENPLFAKLVATGIYMAEYILIIPFIVFFWFLIFTFFLVFLVEESFGVNLILLISAVAVSSIRMASYIPRYGENVARELAKILPITFLGITVLDPSIFTDFSSRVLSRLSEMPLFFSSAFNFFFFIVALEVIMRFFEFLFSLMGIDDIEEQEPEDAY